jgi:hypothetical protein
MLLLLSFSFVTYRRQQQTGWKLSMKVAFNPTKEIMKTYTKFYSGLQLADSTCVL